MPAYWRILETEIVRIARGLDFELDENGMSGDKVLIIDCNDDPRVHQINLTEFAKELAQALGMQT